MIIRTGLPGVAGLTVVLLAASAHAASSLSYSLTDPIGYSPLPGTQNALASVGLTAADWTAISTIAFEGNGAKFGSVTPADPGRNYLRTIGSDFATVSFVAEVTFELISEDQSVFIGLGAGDIALWGTPDWSTQASSASFWVESFYGGFNRFKTHNDSNTFQTTTVANIYGGTHRFRMTFDAATKQLLGEIDLNHTGGPFAADATTGNAPILTSQLFAIDGWPNEPSRIFFGGDDGAIFRDLVITVLPGPTLTGDLNSDGFVGIADLNIVLGKWNQNVTAGNKLLGDPSGDGFVGILDLNTVLGNWNAGTPPASSVPEPACAAVLGLCGMTLLRRRTT